MNEHVFREQDGKLELVGDFDGLYREDPDPWGQAGHGLHAAYYSESRARLAKMLRRRLGETHFSGIEIGCGHGHVTEFLAEAVGGDWRGMDISAVAVKRAKALHPQINFHVGDITNSPLLPPRMFKVLVFNQLLWYTLHKLDATVTNCCTLLEPGGLFVLSQGFLREQRYGQKVCNGFHGTLKHFLVNYGERLKLIEAYFDDSRRRDLDDGLMVFRRP